MNTLVFVYGSLKSEHYNNQLLEKSEFISVHVTDSELTLVDLGAFPAVVDKGNTRIRGEIYRVTEKTFSELDKLEGYPKYYNRIEILTDFRSVWTYVYQKNSDDYPIIVSGEWIPEV